MTRKRWRQGEVASHRGFGARCDEIDLALTTAELTRNDRGEDTARARVFTDYVRSLDREGSPEPRRLAMARAALRAVLTGELRRRGLWNAPPSYLGVYGSASWDEALEELLAECYAFVFVDRLRSLQAQLEVKPNIDGLVFLNVRHFLHERQKEHDPLGAQVFQVLQAAVRAAVAAGELSVLAGDARIRNDTVLGLAPDAEPAATAGRESLRFLVARWNDDLLPDLVTLRGRRQEEVVERLREYLGGLADAGVLAFRFKDLIDPLKADVRRRWAALLEPAIGEVGVERGDDEATRMVRLVRPDTGFEERQLFRRLIACVLAAIERLDVSGKTRDYLTTLWQFLRVEAAEGGAQEGEGRLSRRRIAELLGIPRDRLPELYETLGRFLERCRAANSGKPSVTPLAPGFTPEDQGGIAP
jgi:hypothetical protein